MMSSKIKSKIKQILAITVAMSATVACSPVAPSVSKLSNAAAHPTQATNKSEELNNLELNKKTDLSNLDESDQAEQTTEIITLTDFETKNLLKTNDERLNLFILDEKNSINEFSIKGKIIFGSNAEVHGKETKILHSKVRIYLVMNSVHKNLEKVEKSKELSELKLKLSWKEARSNETEGHWDLRIQKNPALELTNSEVKDLLKNQLHKIGIEFSNNH